MVLFVIDRAVIEPKIIAYSDYCKEQLENELSERNAMVAQYNEDKANYNKMSFFRKVFTLKPKNPEVTRGSKFADTAMSDIFIGEYMSEVNKQEKLLKKLKVQGSLKLEEKELNKYGFNVTIKNGSFEVSE